MLSANNSINQAISTSVAGNKLALIVGVNNSSTVLPYRSALKYAEKDAEDMAYLLKQSECGFTLLTPPIIGELATTSRIKNDLMNLSLKRTQQDFLLFYFAGHVLPIKNDIYFATHDFQEDIAEKALEADTHFYLSMRWLWQVFYQSTEAGRVLIILDCCYAGNLVEVNDDPFNIDLHKLLKKWDTGAASTTSPNCLRLILTATGYNIQAQEMNEHGLMTGLLMKALHGEIDDVLDKEGRVDIRILHRYLQDNMPQEQRPDLAGKFGPFDCILACYPHRSEHLRRQLKENEIKKEVEKGILSELSRLHAETQHNQPFDHMVCYSASLADLDEEQATEFLKRERTQQDDSFRPDSAAHDQLIQFGFLQKSFPTYGALLCFGQTPSKWVAGAITRCIDWSGTTTTDHIQDSREYKGSLLQQFEYSLNFLKKKLRLSRVISHQGREEQWEIPAAVLEEALANALVHREYANRTDPVRVEVFDDRIEICSPGKLPPPMTEELLQMRHKSYPRNPQIAGIFYLYGYIEKLGAGIERMRRFMQDENLAEPKFISGEDQTFTVVLYRPKYPSSSISGQVDWGVAPQIERFYGREKELTELKRWIVDDHCQQVLIYGMGGIGKTCLTVKLAEQIQKSFEYIIWRSLKNAPPLTDFLRDAIQFLSHQDDVDLPENIEHQIALLIRYLRERRCLLILDNIDVIFQAGHRAGEYRVGYENYGELFQRIGLMKQSQSCLLLTSREMLKGASNVEEPDTSVRSLFLTGLSELGAEQLLRDSGLSGTDSAPGRALIQLYAGNPLALKIIVYTIRNIFAGDIAEFLQQENAVLDDIDILLEHQIRRLSSLERDIMRWLAIERELVSLDTLKTDLIPLVPTRELLSAMRSLQQRLMIETSNAGFTLQPIIMEYIISDLVQQVIQELETETMGSLGRYALMKASSQDYVRESQLRLILGPVAQRLISNLGRDGFKEKCKGILSKLRTSHYQHSTYAAGNILNLLIHLGCDLRGYDFSGLTVCQAYLQGTALQDVNFTGAHFLQSLFTDTFGGILSIAISPDEALFAAGTINGEIRLWHTASGAPMLTCQGHTDWVRSVEFSPDGKFFASGSEDHSVRLWEVNSGHCLSILEGHTAPVSAVAFSPDGEMLASGSDDKTVRLWSAQTKRCLSVLQGHDSSIWSVAFNPTGEILVSGSEDQTIRFWGLSSGHCLKVLQGHTGPVHSVAYSPDGNRIASGSDDHTIRLWDADSGQCLKILQGHTDWIWSVAYSPDGNRIASGSDDHTIRLWDADSGQCLRTLVGHTNTAWSVAFSFGGSLLASGSTDQTVRLWDVNSGQCLRKLQGYTNGVLSITVSPDGSTIASGCEDHTIRLWDVDTGKCFKILSGHGDRVFSVAIGPDKNMLATTSTEVRLWDINSGQCLKILPDTSWVYSVTFSPNGKSVASSNDDGTVRLWDIDTGECLRIIQEEERVGSVAFSSDGAILVSCGEKVCLWDVASGKLLKTLHGHTGLIYCATFSPIGNFLVEGGEDNRVYVWDTGSGQSLKTLIGHTGAIRSITFSPDGTIIASGSDDGTVRLWDINTGECLAILQGHTGRVSSVIASPSRKTIISGSEDGTIKLWDIQTGSCLVTLRGERPYERMNITRASGLTAAQIAALRALGAFGEID